MLAAVSGALVALIDPDAWEQYGAVTPAQAAAAAFSILEGYYESDVCMIGSIISYITSDPPNACLPCDGSTYNRDDYPTLYAALDPTFIIDADTFQTPDLRGRAVIGAGTGSGLSARAVGATGGEEDHTLTTGEMPSHNHAYHAEYLSSRTGAVDLHTFLINDTGLNTIDTTNTGDGDPHNNMQPFMALKYAVVAR